MFDRLVAGDTDHVHLHLFCLIWEVLRLGWPHHFVSHALQSISKRHQSPITNMMRFLGRRMRKTHFSDIAPLKDLQRVLQSDAMQARVAKCMAERKQERREIFPLTRALWQYLLNRWA